MLILLHVHGSNIYFYLTFKFAEAYNVQIVQLTISSPIIASWSVCYNKGQVLSGIWSLCANILNTEGWSFQVGCFYTKTCINSKQEKFYTTSGKSGGTNLLSFVLIYFFTSNHIFVIEFKYCTNCKSSIWLICVCLSACLYSRYLLITEVFFSVPYCFWKFPYRPTLAKNQLCQFVLQPFHKIFENIFFNRGCMCPPPKAPF